MSANEITSLQLKVYHSLWFHKRRYNLIWGGKKSGKTQFLMQFSLLSLIFSNQTNWYISGQERKDFPIRLIKIYQNEISLLKMNAFFKVTSYQITYLPNKNSLKWISLSQLTFKRESINPTHLWIDNLETTSQEVTETLKYFYKTYLYLTFLPQPKSHWINLFFKKFSSVPFYLSLQKVRTFQRKKKISSLASRLFLSPHILSLYVTHEDNTSLNSYYHQYLESLRKENINFYHQDNKGKIYQDLVAVFPKICQRKNSFSLDNFSELLGGMDFGFKHASVFLICAFKENILYVLRELYETKIAPSVWAKKVKIFLKETLKGKIIHISADSADPGRIEEIKNQRISIHASKKGAGSLLKGFRWISQRKIYIDPSCVNTFRELSLLKQKWTTSKGKLITPSGNDDTLAALRYALEKFFIE